MTYKEREIQAFLAKKSKAAQVLELLLNREYVTCSDIINLDRTSPVVFTTCPHKLIETIRKHFDYDFIKDRDVKFFRVQYNSKGEPFKTSDTYKQYFINKMAV